MQNSHPALPVPFLSLLHSKCEIGHLLHTFKGIISFFFDFLLWNLCMAYALALAVYYPSFSCNRPRLTSRVFDSTFTAPGIFLLDWENKSSSGQKRRYWFACEMVKMLQFNIHRYIYVKFYYKRLEVYRSCWFWATILENSHQHPSTIKMAADAIYTGCICFSTIDTIFLHVLHIRIINM